MVLSLYHFAVAIYGVNTQKSHPSGDQDGSKMIAS